MNDELPNSNILRDLANEIERGGLPWSEVLSPLHASWLRAAADKLDRLEFGARDSN